MVKRDKRAQVFIIENGKYILLKHYHKQENNFFWGVPGGGVEPNETEEEAAIREAYEETGLKIKLLPYSNEVRLPEDYIYRSIITFIGYPIEGVAKTGYDPEADMVNLYSLVDIKWHDIYDIENIDDYTRRDVIPVLNYLKNNHFVKRAGALVVKNEDGVKKILLVSRFINSEEFVLPQGHVEHKETYRDAALRETKEEAGVICKIQRELGFFFYEIAGTFYETHIFLAEYIGDCEMADKRIAVWKSYADIEKLKLPRESRRFIDDYL